MGRKKKAEVKHLWASDFQPGLVANEEDTEEEEREKAGVGGKMLVDASSFHSHRWTTSGVMCSVYPVALLNRCSWWFYLYVTVSELRHRKLKKMFTVYILHSKLQCLGKM